MTIEGETIRLVSFNPKENLLKGATTIASSGQASLAVDGKKETFWHPESLPAVLVVNLPQPASLQRLVLRLAEHSYFTISFLDSSGQTISRYERDWDFWEHMQTRNLYPPKEVTLQVAPVPEVAYLKLELIESLGQAGISELEAYPCPYAACGSLTREIRLPLEATSVQVNWLAEEKQQEVTYSCQMESFRGFPVMRWRSPWLKRPAVSLRQLGGYAGIEFYGTNVSLLLAGIGKVRWQLDTGQSGVIEHPQKEKSEHLLAQDLPAGRHYLWLENEVFPAKEDSYGAGDCEIHGVKVLGQTRVASLVRFGDGKTWGSWLGPVFSGQKVAVASLSGRKPILCQTKVILDSRSVLGQLSPEVKSFSIVATGEAGEKVSAYQEENRPFFREELAEVAEAVNQRAVVVSYPKMGTSQEYEVAREIAEKVGVYLVSDDIGLNLYPGLVLAVGTPQRHRYCRQLLAAVGLWSDPEFLNREEGIVGRFKYGRDQQVDWLFVTGETPRTVVAAGKRLLSRLKTYQRPATAFRLFPADTLEMIYPWQLHMERKNLDSLTLTLGQNDRRSLQFGIVANRLISSLSLSSVKLVSDTGEVLTGVKVRPVGFYEWEPFFGDLRLPNFLIEEPVSLPANTATGIWVTVQTEAETKPGLYRGELTIRGEGQTETVPLSVRVLPVSLEPLAKTKTMSFAAVPWFFHRGTEAWRKAVKSLAENEADHSVSVVSLPMLLDWKCEEGKEPVRQLLVAEEKVAEKMVWTAFNAGSKKIPAGHVLLVEFSSAVRVQQLGTGARVRKISDLAVEVWLADGSWRELNLEEGPPEPLSGEKGTAEPFWYGLFFTGPQEPMSRLRFRSKTGNELEIGRIVAFSEGNRREPFTVDFSLLEQQMSLIEQVYREKKLPLPLFLSQLSYEVGEISGELVGVAHWHQGGCQRMFARQLSSFLRKCGRL
ncbi:MAG TPA: hypothetical protein PKW42_05820, partial [bacterium]|nr:hypothetical protein [bacterium]